MTSSVLLVDDNPAMIQVMGRMLEGLGHLRFATSGADALKKVREAPPDLVLLDAEMPGMSGFEVCEHMKSNHALRDIPIIFVTSHSETEFEALGLDSGASDYLAKPVNEIALVARVKAQLRAKEQADALRHLARVDGLTGMANRRWFDESLEREWLRAQRPGEPISVLLLDLDHFKLFNSRYGHPAGDACLRQVSQALQACLLRPADMVARHGGDEFALLLPGTSRPGAEHLAHRVLRAVEELAIAHATSPLYGHVTVSIGVSSFDTSSSCWVAPSQRRGAEDAPRGTPEDLGRSAKKALYLAQNQGGAQAWTLDVGDVDNIDQAREIESNHRPSCFTPL